MVITWYGGKDNLFRSQNQVNLTWVILLISILYITESDKRLSLSIASRFKYAFCSLLGPKFVIISIVFCS